MKKILLALAVVFAALFSLHRVTSADTPAVGKATQEAGCGVVDLPVSSGANICTNSIVCVLPDANSSVLRVTFTPSGAATTLISVMEIWNSAGTAVESQHEQVLFNSESVGAGEKFTCCYEIRKKSDAGRKLTYNFRVGTSTTVNELLSSQVPIP